MISLYTKTQSFTKLCELKVLCDMPLQIYTFCVIKNTSSVKRGKCNPKGNTSFVSNFAQFCVAQFDLFCFIIFCVHWLFRTNLIKISHNVLYTKTQTVNIFYCVKIQLQHFKKVTLQPQPTVLKLEFSIIIFALIAIIAVLCWLGDIMIEIVRLVFSIGFNKNM